MTAINYALGDKVQYKPFHPGNVWAPEPYWVCGISRLERHNRPTWITYHLALCSDPKALKRIDVLVREDMLRHWEEAG